MLLGYIGPAIVAVAASPAIPPDPVGSYDFPDPAAVHHAGVYYAFGGLIPFAIAVLHQGSSQVLQAPPTGSGGNPRPHQVILRDPSALILRR